MTENKNINMNTIYAIQKEMQEKFRQEHTESIVYMGRQFYVKPSVFWPSQDSIALVQHMYIPENASVLDLCTGAGVIAVFAALKGAKSVVALDINPLAIECTTYNAQINNVANNIDARVSDMFTSLSPDETFDIITMNPPFTNHSYEENDLAEKTVWDAGLYVHRTFFEQVGQYLNPEGKIYLAHANFGAINEMKQLAEKHGFNHELINARRIDENRTFYAFELTRNL